MIAQSLRSMVAVRLGKFLAAGTTSYMPLHSSEPNDSPASSDALSLFGAEAHRSSAPSGERQVSADSADALALNSIIGTAPLRFVEGVAIVQALSAAAKAKGGMPNLDGVFVKSTGEVVVVGPPSVEPPARELARLLHRLVPAEGTPPVGRLFVDRWASGASTDLNEFNSELAYFARPNGQELLSALHARSAGKPAAPSTVPPVPVPPSVRAEVPASPLPPRQALPPRPEPGGESWLRTHRRQIVVAAMMIIAVVTATALVTWFWPSKTAEAATAPAEAPAAVSSAPAKAPKAPAKPQPKDQRTANTDSRATARLSAVPGVPTAKPARNATPSAIVAEGARPAAITSPQPVAAADVADSPVVATLPQRAVPDMRIYSSADAEIEPPKLRSNEIPEFLIAGFERRPNSVEVIVNARGAVERVRMLGTPQRIPDIMLLSRVKEWLFDPATRDGAAVRYRMILTWNVTP